MHNRRIWTTALAAVLTLVITTGYVSARVKSQAASQPAGEDADDVVTFRVRIQNISADSDPSTLFASGVWILHNEAGPLFASGNTDRGAGLEALAEDGDPTTLAGALRAQGLHAGIFDTPVCVDTPGPLPSSDTVEFGDTYEFEVTASPATPYLSFATMLVQSNDLFLAPTEKGLALFDENGTAMRMRDVTAELFLWDAGTEANEEPGVGPNQAPRQLVANTGNADEMTTVRPVDDGFSYHDVADMVKVTIVPVLMVKRDSRLEQIPTPHKIGDDVRIGEVEWRVLSAENLGHELKAKSDRQITDERFIQVRFQFLNNGSDPLEFEAVEDLSVRDSEGRVYAHYRVPGFPTAHYPKEFIIDDEECFGRWWLGTWRTFVLKPNILTTCTTIFEVNVDGTDLVLVSSDLVKGQVSATTTFDLDLPPVSASSIGKDVRVGDVRWHVLSAEDYGHVLEGNGNRVKTEGRFIRVRFQLTNKSSDDLSYQGVPLRDTQGRQYDHGHFEVIPDSEKCSGGILGGGYPLKPNTPTICMSVYEIPASATGLIFITSDLGGVDDGAEAIDLALSDLVPIPLYILGEDVEVGDVCWRALSVEDLGKELSNNGDQETTDGRFLQVRFRFLNLGSNTLGYDGVPLGDSQGRRYKHYGKRASFISDDELCPRAVLPLPGPYPLEPNVPTTCTTIYEVANDAAKFILAASDLEGFETALIALPPLSAATTTTPTVPPGTYEVGKNIAPGVYRGEAPDDSFCKWARMKDLNEEPESITAMGLREGPFYLEILDSDSAFTTECDLVPIEHLESRDSLLTAVSPGMYLVGLDIGPGKYKGEPQENLFCFWQRLNNFREEDDSTIEWDIPGEEYIVEVSPSDYAVEFACPVQKVE